MSTDSWIVLSLLEINFVELKQTLETLQMKYFTDLILMRFIPKRQILANIANYVWRSWRRILLSIIFNLLQLVSKYIQRLQQIINKYLLYYTNERCGCGSFEIINDAIRKNSKKGDMKCFIGYFFVKHVLVIIVHNLYLFICCFLKIMFTT